MVETPKPRAVVRFRMRPERAQAIVRQIALDTGKVIIGDHAKERMGQREISDIEVYRLLQTGHVMEEPTQTDRNEWKCKVTKKLKGNREAGVVTIILRSGCYSSKRSSGKIYKEQADDATLCLKRQGKGIQSLPLYSVWAGRCFSPE